MIHSLTNKPLLYTSDLRALDEKLAKKGSLTPFEAGLLNHTKLSESQIQQACARIFKLKFGQGFFQIDNGGKMGIAQRIKKMREGTEPGAPDAMLIRNGKALFVEFKRIGVPSQVDPRPEQKIVHEFLRSQGFTVWVTNNVAYFEKVICAAIN